MNKDLDTFSIAHYDGKGYGRPLEGVPPINSVSLELYQGTENAILVLSSSVVCD